MNWWKKEPLRIIEICNGHNLDTVSGKELLEAVKNLGGNVQHFHCMDTAGGLDDRRFFFKTEAAAVDNPDLLGEYIPMAREAGIRVIVYFNVHWYTRDFGQQHPNWVQLRENGEPIDDVYATGTSCCINSPYRDWVFQVVRDLCKYDIDGIFYDGPIFFHNTCYCEACKQQFRERTGQEMPLKSDYENVLWKELLAFQSDSIQRFLTDTDKIIKEANPEILLCMNGNTPSPNWATGRDNRKIARSSDILGAEGGFMSHDLNQVSLYKPGVTAKLLEAQAKERPLIVFDCAGWKLWSWYLLPEAEIRLLLAQTVAHGANYWLAVLPDDINQPEMDGVVSFGKTVADNPGAFLKSKSLAKTAMVWPAQTMEYYNGSSVPVSDFTDKMDRQGIGNVNEEFHGLYEALVRAQTPFDLIDDASTADLSGYQLIILPNAACMSAADTEALRQYVAQGGNLAGTFESSLYDQEGRRQDDFQLADVFGISFSGNILGPMEWDYIQASDSQSTLLLGGINKKYLPAPRYGIEVTTTSGRAILNYCKKLKGRYDNTPQLSPHPFLIENTYGQGKAVYIAGTFGGSLWNFHFPEYLKLIRNICDQRSDRQVGIPECPWVEISLRQRGEQIYLHLINRTSGPKRPITYIHPLQDMKIELFGMPVKSVRAIRSGQDLQIEKHEGKVKLVLPKLEDYEIIEILI
ncbi:MAG: beta-galactosidase trimerization domain-containing protein [bacterium]|nr:beta-galactosidase trimerization domain-containing protein [bacterium]